MESALIEPASCMASTFIMTFMRTCRVCHGRIAVYIAVLINKGSSRLIRLIWHVGDLRRSASSCAGYAR